MSPNLSSRDVREARSWLEPDTSGADGVTAFRGRSAMETSVFSGLCGNSEYIGPASGFVALDSMRQLQRHSSTCHQKSEALLEAAKRFLTISWLPPPLRNSRTQRGLVLNRVNRSTEHTTCRVAARNLSTSEPESPELSGAEDYKVQEWRPMTYHKPRKASHTGHLM